jgi:hypothetical protein
VQVGAFKEIRRSLKIPERTFFASLCLQVIDH